MLLAGLAGYFILKKTLKPLTAEVETLEEKVARVLKEEVAIVPYDSRWPEIFEQAGSLRI